MRTYKPAFSESPRSAAAMAKMNPLMPKKMWYGIIVSRCAAFNCGNKNVAKPTNHWNMEGSLLMKERIRISEFLPDTRTQWSPTLRPTSAANRNWELAVLPIHGNRTRPIQRTASVRKFRQTSTHATTLNCVCGKSGSHGTIGWLHRKRKVRNCRYLQMPWFAISLTIPIKVYHSDCHQQRMPIKLNARRRWPTQSAQIGKHPTRHQNYDCQPDQLEDDVNQIESLQPDACTLLTPIGCVHFLEKSIRFTFYSEKWRKTKQIPD